MDMKFRNLKRRRLTESTELNFMELMNRAIARHTGRLNEAFEDEDDTEGLDEFDSEDADFEDDFDAADDEADIEDETMDMDDDMDDMDDMVTITVPREVADQLLGATEEAVGEGGGAEDLISDEDVAEADANIAADDAADAALDAEDAELAADDAEFDAEEDEEAFAVTNTNASPRRERFTGSYRNEPTVPSIIKGAIAKSGYVKTVADGAPRRERFTGSYRNEPTVKSRYTPGKTRILQNTID